MKTVHRTLSLHFFSGFFAVLLLLFGALSAWSDDETTATPDTAPAVTTDGNWLPLGDQGEVPPTVDEPVDPGAVSPSTDISTDPTGEVKPATPALVVPFIDTTPPTVPTNFTATINGQDANRQTVQTPTFNMIFNWNASEDLVSGVKQYHIRLLDGDDNGHVGATWFIPMSADPMSPPVLAGTPLSYQATVSGLISGHTYFYFIQAQDNADQTGEAGDLWSDWALGGQFVLNTSGHCILKPQNDVVLSGFGANESNSTATGTFTNYSPLCTYQVAVSSYKSTVAWTGTNTAAFLAGQQHFDIKNTTLGTKGSMNPSSTATLTANIPTDCPYQVDAFEYHNTDPILVPPDFGAHLDKFTLFDWKMNTTRTCPNIPQQPGVCGPAARTYQFSETAFSGALCAVGDPVPASPAFPAPGGTVEWQCRTTAGTAFCGATRLTTSNGIPPQGFHDNASCAVTQGWACDPDAFNVPLQIELYDGPFGAGGHLIGTTTANMPREAAVGVPCGGNANHGFSFDIPANLRTTQTHNIYAYALDITGTQAAGVFGRRLLNNSPQSFTCPQGPTAVLSKSVHNDTSGASNDGSGNVSANAGDVLTYTLHAQNPGNTPITNFVFRDDVSDLLPYADISNISNGGELQLAIADPSGQLFGTIVWPAMTIPGGQTLNVTFQATIKVQTRWPQGGDLRLTNVYGNTITINLPSAPVLSKSVHNNTTGFDNDTNGNVNAKAGDNLTYTLRAQNTGNTPITNFFFTDDVSDLLPYADISNISNGGLLHLGVSDPSGQIIGTIGWPAMTIPAGQAITVTFQATIKKEIQWPQGGDLRLTNVYGNTIIVLLPPTELTCSLTANPTSVASGGFVTLNWNILSGRSIGGSLASNPLVNIPGPNDFTRNGSVGSVGPINALTTFTLSLLDSDGRTHTCSTTVGITQAGAADVTITKSAPTPIGVGENVIYTVTYANQGGHTANNVNIIDTSTPTGILGGYTIIEQPAQGSCAVNPDNSISCALGTLIPGATGRIRYRATGLAVGTVINTAVISTEDFEINTLNNTASASVSVLAAQSLSCALSFTQNPIAVGSTGTLAWDILSGTPTNANLTVTPTVNVPGANDFLHDGSAVNVGPIHQATTFVLTISDAAGRSNSCSTTVNVTGVALAKSVHNQRTGLNSDASGNLNAMAGDELIYTLSARNTGSTIAAHIFTDSVKDVREYATISDISNGGRLDIDQLTWPAVFINPGDTATVTFKATVKQQSEWPQGGDLRLTNFYGNVITVILPPPVGLTLSKSVLNTTTGLSNDANGNVNADATHVLIYTLHAQNNGDNPIPNFIFRDAVADVLEYATISNISNGGTLDLLTNPVSVSWPAINIAGHSTATVTFQATIKARTDWPQGGDLRLTNVYGNTLTVILPPTPGLILSKSVHNDKTNQNNDANGNVNANVGDTLTYTLSAHNSGTTTISHGFSDNILDLLEYATISDISIGGTLSAGQLNWSAVSIAPGGTATVTFKATIIPSSQWPQGGDLRLVNVYGNTITVILPPGGLQITKTASTSSVTSGGLITYTIDVRNTLSTAQSFTISDTMVARPSDPQDFHLSGNNGGFIAFNRNSNSFVFNPAGSGTATGPNDLAGQNNGVFSVTNLQPGAALTITYTARASDQAIGSTPAIPSNQSSRVLNVAKILETGLQDDAEVFIVGPTSNGGCTTNCGGGGGGGGGGSRTVDGSINVFVLKEVFNPQSKTWNDANNLNLAALIPDATEQNILYRLTLRNEGNIAGDLTVEDKFQSSSLARRSITQVNGGEWDAAKQIFTVKNVTPGKTVTVNYTATIAKTAATSNAQGVNTATIIDATNSGALPFNVRLKETLGVGRSDPAFIKVFGDVVLSKRVDKELAMPGDELNYVITLRNVGGNEYQNINLIDSFPYQYLDIISMDPEGVRNGDTLTFQKNVLGAQKAIVVRIKAKIKKGVAAGTVIPNSVKVSATGQNFSDKEARVETRVDFIKPPANVSTGPQGIALILFLTFSGLLYVRLRRRGLVR